MGKLKGGKCFLCYQPLQRHDPNRVIVRIARRTRKEAHLSCHQNKLEVQNVET